MNSDIRLSIAFKGHRKRKKLRRLIGDRSDSYLLDLWLTVALDRPDGILTGWTADDVADSCGWEDAPQVLVDALVGAGWIDINKDGLMSVHDWQEHQSWACNAKARSEKARKAAEKRWESKNGGKEPEPKTPDESNGYNSGNADAMLGACSEQCDIGKVAYAPILSPPFHSNINNTSDSASKPASSDTEIPPLNDPDGSLDVKGGKGKIVYPEPFLEFWKEYPRKVGKGVALKAYKNIKVPRPSLKQIIGSVQAHSKTEQWQTKKHIPHPSTYLNERRWEDELSDEDFKSAPKNQDHYQGPQVPKSETITFEYDEHGRPIIEN
jgi:hypothetical protein